MGIGTIQYLLICRLPDIISKMCFNFDEIRMKETAVHVERYRNIVYKEI